MTILKASQTAGRVAGFRITPLSDPEASPASANGSEVGAQAHPPRHEPSDTTLAKEIVALEGALEAARHEIIATREGALEEGRQLGLSEAADRQQERLQALLEKLSEGVQAVEAHLAGCEEQGVAIARAVLRRVLGDRAEYVSMVTEIAAHWRQRLADTTVMRVFVSPQDFPGEADLAALQLRLGNVAIERDPAMASGDCRFSLALGDIDLSVPVQADAVERLLASHSPESAAA